MESTGILPPVWEIPAEFRDRLGDQVGRQRAMTCDGHLLLILHDPPAPDQSERDGQFFWRQPDGTWSSSKLGSGPQALEKHLDAFQELVTRFESQDEEADSATDYFAVLHGLAPIRRSSSNMHQTLQQGREMCPQDRNLINLRDRAYQIERAADLLINDAKTSLDFLIAKRTEEHAENSEQMAIASHRLNLLAAFFFPMATLCALFGVNLKHGLEAIQNLSEITSAPAPSFPFIAMVLIGIVLGGFLTRFISNKVPASKPK
ncbi:MAG: hypothetical protein VX346_08570 [Planctomycetota bacterium]|nr:hypothetical protein [Planctomycetota bacterium]